MKNKIPKEETYYTENWNDKTPDLKNIENQYMGEDKDESSSLKIKEVFAKMQNQFYEGIKCGKLSAEKELNSANHLIRSYRIELEKQEKETAEKVQKLKEELSDSFPFSFRHVHKVIQQIFGDKK